MKKIYKVIIGLVVLFFIVSFVIFIIAIVKGREKFNLEKSLDKKEIVDTTNNKIKKAKTEKICLEVPTSLKNRIESGLNTKGITIRNVKAVKSNDYKNTYFVSADMQGAGFERKDDIVTFSVNSLEGNTMILSVNYVAKEFFVYPKVDDRMTLHGAKESQKCSIKSK